MKNKSLLREFMKYSSLNVLGMIGLSCYILADTFFVSKGLGANGLTALNLAIPIYSFIHGCGQMFGMGGAIKYTIFKSQDHQKRANKVFSSTVCVTLFTGFLFVLLGLFFSETITTLLGADDKVADMTNTYLKVVLLFAPAFMMNDAMLNFVRNDGNPRLAMFAMLGGSLSNIVLDYIFIFPMKMGIFGAVFATGLAPVISLTVLSFHRFSKKKSLHFTKSKIAFHTIKETMSLGFSSLITELASGIVIIMFNMIILRLAGNVGVAAYGVIANLSLVIVAIYTGIAQGSQPLFSRAYGNSDLHSIRRILRYALMTMTILSAFIYAILFVCNTPITSIFNNEGNAQLQIISETGMRIYFTAIIFVGFNIILSAYFTSTEHPFPAQIISLARGFVLIIPIAILFANLFGIIGVWLSFPVTECLVSIAGLLMKHFDHKKNLYHTESNDQGKTDEVTNNI